MLQVESITELGPTEIISRELGLSSTSAGNLVTIKLLLLAAALAATAVSARPSPALVRQIHSPAQAKYPHYERVQPRFVHHDEEGYGRSHMWVDEGAAKALAPVASQHTMMGYWWNFAHPNATKDDAAHKACDCKPGYHFALDVKCHVDAFGHL